MRSALSKKAVPHHSPFITEEQWSTLPIGSIIYDTTENRYIQVSETTDTQGVLQDPLTIGGKDLFRKSIHKGRLYDLCVCVRFEPDSWWIATADEIPDPYWRTRSILERCAQALQNPASITPAQYQELIRTTLVEASLLARPVPLSP